VNKQNHTLTQGNNIKSYVNCVLDVKNAINLITDTTQRLSVINTYIKIPLLQACREMTFFIVLFATFISIDNLTNVSMYSFHLNDQHLLKRR